MLKQPPQQILDSVSKQALRGTITITHGCKTVDGHDKILSVYETKNFVVRNAIGAVKDLLINAWSGGAAPFLARMAIGNGGYSAGVRIPPSAAWENYVAMQGAYSYSKDFTSAISSVYTGGVWTVTSQCRFTYGEDSYSGSTNVNEIGLILLPSGGQTGIVSGTLGTLNELFAYRTFTERAWDTAGTYIDVSWTIYIDRT